MANNQQLSLVVLDIGGVMVDIDKAPLHQLLQRNANSERAFFDDAFVALQTGRLTPSEFLKRKSIELNLDHAALNAAFTSMISTKTSGFVLASLTVPYLFLSNINEMHFDIFSRHNNISAFAKSHSLLSYHVGYLKPDSRFFAALDQRIAQMATSALYIDDKLENLARASALGFQTAHCPSNERLAGVLRARGLI